MIASLKAKAVVYVALAHLGLAFTLAAVFHAQAAGELGSTTLSLILVGVGLSYSAFLFSVLSVWLPLRPWIARYERCKSWHQWVLHELPTLLALVPVLLSALKTLKTAWNEIRDHQEKGDLNVQNLAEVARKFATEADNLSHQPSVELAKKRIRESA